LFILWRSISIQNFIFPRWMVQVLHQAQKFERPPFWNGWSYGIKKYSFGVTFNGMTSLLNFIKNYQLVQNVLGWGGGAHRQTDRQTDRRTGDLISLTFLFEESRLKILVMLYISDVWSGLKQYTLFLVDVVLKCHMVQVLSVHHVEIFRRNNDSEILYNYEQYLWNIAWWKELVRNFFKHIS
jgi:hypothetical protein